MEHLDPFFQRGGVAIEREAHSFGSGKAAAMRNLILQTRAARAQPPVATVRIGCAKPERMKVREQTWER
jgi:hypothetical protein